jgi:hypothetical protein
VPAVALAAFPPAWIGHRLADFFQCGLARVRFVGVARVRFRAASIAFEVVWIAGYIVETMLYLEKPRF